MNTKNEKALTTRELSQKEFSIVKEVKDEYLEYVEKKYDRDDEVNQEASIDFEKVGQLKPNPVSNDEKLKKIMEFSKDFGLDATTKVLEMLNQYKDEEKEWDYEQTTL